MAHINFEHYIKFAQKPAKHEFTNTYPNIFTKS